MNKYAVTNRNLRLIFFLLVSLYVASKTAMLMTYIEVPSAGFQSDKIFILPENHTYIKPNRKIQRGKGIRHGKNIGGLFNTGTNYLEKMIVLNCEKVRWNQTYWKHKFWYPNQWQFFPKVPYVFLIKDPLTWMLSICDEVKHRGKIQGLFPTNFTSVENFSCARDVMAPWTISSQTHHHRFASLAEVWDEYYSLVLHAQAASNHSILVIKFEDLLESPDKILTEVCKHLGGKRKVGGLRIYEDSAKAWGHTRMLNFTHADIKSKYLDPAYRYNNWNQTLLKQFERVLNDLIIHTFNYDFEYDYMPESKKHN
mmetsp:Transcript_3619/g.4289  ORF Transcript_3619/g.4289 Transcript_3619/m.4289 type:complete len:311 (+) Transcript_3619:291-1223(+)